MTAVQVPPIFQNVLKQQKDTFRVLKNRKVLDGKDYRRMEKEYDRKSFLQPLDADNTKANIYFTRRKFIRYCAEKKVKYWRRALLARHFTKGKMIGFLRWICETYVVPKLKKGSRTKRKTINQYWRDLKMLYRRANGAHVNANDSYEVVKFINGPLAVDYELDIMPKPKPVAGVDELLLLLAHHWTRDKSVFPTEDDRLDTAAITLFQAYTGGRPAEFVDASKGDACKDPLGEAEELQGCGQTAERPNPGSELGGAGEAVDDLFDDDDEALYKSYDEDIFDSDDDENWAEKDDVFYDNEEIFDSDNEGSAEDETVPDRTVAGSSYTDSGYSSDKSDVTMTEDRADCYPVEVEDGSSPFQRREGAPALDDVEEEIRKWKVLCYEDITLWIVQNPKPGGRDRLAMEVFLRHHKGADNKPKPTVFLFRENDLPILCPISHIVARAIRDDAILADGWDNPEKFFGTDLRRMGRPAIPVRWKPQWLKRPVFRRSVEVQNVWVKSETEPFAYSKYNFYLKRLGIALGLLALISYCFRRATLNAVDGAAPDAVRDQVARQQPFCGTFNGAYLNERVRFNVQDAYLESEVSEDGLTRVFTHMSVRRRLDSPAKAPSELVRQLTDADPTIARLRQEVHMNRKRLKAKYKLIKRSPEKEKQEHNKLKNRLKSEQRNLGDALHDAYSKDCELQAYNEMMKMQLNPSTIEEQGDRPKVQHQLKERTQLEEVLCDFSRDLTPQEIVTRKVAAITLLVALASRQELQTRQPRLPPDSQNPLEENPPVPADEFPLVCEKTQCIFCIGNERLSYKQQTRTFNRVSHMWDHVENVHLSKVPAGQRIICRHPVCKAQGLVLDNVILFKNHVAEVHEIDLRPGVFPY